MSHFSKIEVTMDSLESVKKALEQMGYTVIEGRRMMENRWGESTEVDLEVKELKSQIGFYENEEGEVEMQADWYGLGINEEEFTEQVTQLHSKYKTLDSLQRDGWKLSGEEEILEDGSIKMSVRRWG